MEKRLVRIILSVIEFGAKPRHKVTDRIKNYDKHRRLAAIKYCLDENLVSLDEIILKNSPGRNPVFIEITEKGRTVLKELRSEFDQDSVWCAR